MSRLGQYLLSVIAVSILVAVSSTFMSPKSAISPVFKLISGMILTLTILTPWTTINWMDYNTYLYFAKEDASSIVTEAEECAKTEISKLIKKKIQAYILDKAASLSADIAVDVELTKGSPVKLQKVKISGNASPYAKKRLKEIISNDLGVSEANQEWS